MAHTDRTDQLPDRGFEPYEPHPDQLDLFGPPPAGSRGPDPAGVRAELAGILAEAKLDDTEARPPRPHGGDGGSAQAR
jgi:hypothetical protein